MRYKDNQLPFSELFLTYTKLVEDYTNRALTNPSDTLEAFSGVTSVLARFSGSGFISGLPEAILDLVLIWIPGGPGKRRSASESPSAAKFPSWAWASWQGGD
jgi:hypothetical protein